MNESLWEIMDHGGGAMWVIVAGSVLTIAVAIERAVAQWGFVQRARALSDTVTRCIARGALAEGRAACERSQSPLADVFLVGYERLGRTSRDALEGAVNRERTRLSQALRTRLWVLGTIGALAPFVGLFGTVIGIMQAFGDISEQGAGGLAVVSGGISAALWATAAGIAVGVEAVTLFNYFNQRSARIATELKLLTDEFLEQLRELDPEATAASKPTAAGGGDGAREAA